MRSKYGAKKVRTASGEVYDSKKEYRRSQVLKQQEREGKISNLKRQVKYELIPSQRDENGKCIERACNYIADFVYEKDGATVVEDTKGLKTAEYIIKRKLMLYKYGIRVVET